MVLACAAIELSMRSAGAVSRVSEVEHASMGGGRFGRNVNDTHSSRPATKLAQCGGRGPIPVVSVPLTGHNDNGLSRHTNG